MHDAHQVLANLREGNKRFVDGVRCNTIITGPERRQELLASQSPSAIILGCSDSRVPAELVFDQGIGDLFVIRIAGNIVAPSQIGSVEFAASQFGTPLVVVLGHSSCGAVSATLEEIARPSADQSPNLRSIVERIRPGIEPLLNSASADDPLALLAEAVRANVRAATEQLSHGSDILEGLVADNKLLIVGAEYSLETGVVEFLLSLSMVAKLLTSLVRLTNLSPDRILPYVSIVLTAVVRMLL